MAVSAPGGWVGVGAVCTGHREQVLSDSLDRLLDVPTGRHDHLPVAMSSGSGPGGDRQTCRTGEGLLAADDGEETVAAG